jgi:hypothetical protein
LLNILKNSIWRDNPEPGWQPRHPWFMLPNFVWSIALLAFIPLISKFKKNLIIILNIFIISFLWIFSAIHFKHFIFLDIAKVSVIGSYFLILMFVLALSYLCNYLKKNTNILSKEIIFVIIFFTYLFAILSLSSYTKLDKWKNLTLIADRVYTPTAPATEFLKERDLEVFSQFKHKRFISHPFKSLVIAATTLNYPLNSKTSIISNRVYYYQDFIKLNCQEMSEVAEKYNLDYVYLPFLSCPQFKFIEEGGDRFKLYEYISE